MKVFFTASLRGKSILGENYRRIYKGLEELGCKVLNNNILTEDVHQVIKKDKKELTEFFMQSRRLIQEADVLLAEVTYPSTNVGYEISVAAEMGKSIAALHVKDETPLLIATVDYDMINVYPYTLGDLHLVLKRVIDDAQSTKEVRFNFLLPKYLSNYLHWISKRKKIPRSVYIRQLIEDDMRANPEYLYPSRNDA